MASESTTSIRISKAVRDEIKEVALPKESIQLTIQRLIAENKQLKKADERNDELIKMYRFRTAQMDVLNIKSEFLDCVMDNHFGTYNHCIDSFNRLSEIILSETPDYAELKDAFEVCASELGNDELRVVFNYLKVCYAENFDEHGLLAKLEDEMEVLKDGI